MPMQKIPAARFKSQCLALMEQVAQSGRPIVVTKHGKPIVQITPVEHDEDEIFGFLKGKGRIVGDIMNSIPLTDWNLPE
jgi:prevent-host-death family protein